MSDSEDERNEKLKFVILGDCRTGKTSLSLQYSQNIYKEPYSPTLGVDFFMKRISFAEDFHVALQVWDLSGKSMDGKMLDKYLYGCHGVLLMYDVTDVNSFKSLPDWLNTMHNVLDPSVSPPRIILVGNKIDLEPARAIRNEDHMSFACKHGLLQTYVSAKTGEFVSLCFKKLAASILKVKNVQIGADEVVPVMRAEVSVTGSGDQLKKQQSGEIPKILKSQTKPSSACCLS